MRRELQSRVDQLQIQLTYWQITTLTVIKDHVTTGEVDMQVHVHVLCEYRTGEVREGRGSWERWEGRDTTLDEEITT